MEMKGGASPTFHGGPAESGTEDIPLYVKLPPAQAPDVPRFHPLTSTLARIHMMHATASSAAQHLVAPSMLPLAV